MRKTIGSVLVIDTNPPYKRWDGNQATYLFFPVFAAFLLVLLSALSDPIIPGLSIVNVNTGINGTVKFGSWGWCSSGVPGVSNRCSTHRAFGKSMRTELDLLPVPVKSLSDISSAINGSYLIAMAVMHTLACIATWLTTTWTLAAAGAWRRKDQAAWHWTQWSFSGTFWSALFIIVAWGLELGMLTRVQAKAINVDGTQPHVTPGPAIFMLLAALICCSASFIARVTWLKFKPRPEWTIKGAQGDFINPSRPPLSGALPPADEHPPTWDSLNIDDAKDVIIGDNGKPSVDQPGFTV